MILANMGLEVEYDNIMAPYGQLTDDYMMSSLRMDNHSPPIAEEWVRVNAFLLPG